MVAVESTITEMIIILILINLIDILAYKYYVGLENVNTNKL